MSHSDYAGAWMYCVALASSEPGGVEECTISGARKRGPGKPTTFWPNLLWRLCSVVKMSVANSLFDSHGPRRYCAELRT